MADNELDSNVIVSALQFWKKVYDEKEVTIKFTKKDGSIRLMKCTLDFNKVPDVDRPKGVDIKKIIELIQKNKIMHVYDLEKKAWRSVPFERVEYMDTDEERYYVKPKK
jgi:predicted transcriptional regulator